MDVTEENYDFIFDINVRGAWLGMQEQARQMIKQGKQKEPYKILHVASILSRETFDDVVIYGASKHAVAGLIKGGAKGLAEYGINVNGYGPGVVRTEMWEQLDKELVAMGKFKNHGESMDSIAENMILMKRYSYPEDIVGTASFLASGESDYMTGQILMIDGGMVIQ
jgi:meso-butanediol dehydrogenase/(S,S)-butanediol dehydrogenase/diacetyl reductase